MLSLRPSVTVCTLKCHCLYTQVSLFVHSSVTVLNGFAGKLSTVIQIRCESEFMAKDFLGVAE